MTLYSASQLLYDHLGRPPVDGLVAEESQCWVCGGILSQGVPWRDWAGASFVGQNRVRSPHSEHVGAGGLVDAVQAFADEAAALAVLRDVEWQSDVDVYACCPCCGGIDSRLWDRDCEFQRVGHTHNCRLAAVLRAAGAAETESKR